MSNIYTNHKAKLSTNALTTIYTVPAEKAAIIKSIRVSNEDVVNDCNISVSLVDTDSISYNLETDRVIQAKRSQEILATGNMAQDTSDSSVAAPLIVKESEKIQAQAQNGNDLSIIISVLEISNR